MNRHRFLQFGVALAALSLCIGCTDPGVVVTGSVSADGKPLEYGIVRLIPGDASQQGRTGNVAEGVFKIEGVRPGPHKVIIQPSQPPPPPNVTVACNTPAAPKRPLPKAAAKYLEGVPVEISAEKCELSFDLSK